MTSPIPLRERLAGVLACRCDPAWTERKLHDPRCLEELQDDVLENVRDWLRDRAQQRQAEINEFPTDSYEPVKFPVEAASALRAEADAIDKELNQ